MADIIPELTKKALQEGDVESLKKLIQELARKEKSGKIVKVVRDFLKKFPEQASAVRDILRGLVQTLPPKVARKVQAMAKLVEKLGGLFPKRPPLPPSGAWQLFKSGVASLARTIAKGALGLFLQVYGFFGPVGTAVVVAVVIALLAVGIYLLLKKPSGSPFCDCTRVRAGLITREYQEQCRDREGQLQKLVASCFISRCVRATLKLTAGPDGKLKTGEFCDTIANGPYAWPVREGPQDPPPRPPDEAECDGVSGISRECEDR